MLHGGTLVSYISNEGGVAICMERLVTKGRQYEDCRSGTLPDREYGMRQGT